MSGKTKALEGKFNSNPAPLYSGELLLRLLTAGCGIKNTNFIRHEKGSAPPNLIAARATNGRLITADCGQGGRGATVGGEQMSQRAPGTRRSQGLVLMAAGVALMLVFTIFSLREATSTVTQIKGAAIITGSIALAAGAILYVAARAKIRYKESDKEGN